MKHFFVTLFALLSISYAFAGTHSVWILDDPTDPRIVTIVDQNGNHYEDVLSANYYSHEYTIEDGTTLTFTLNTTEYIMYYIVDDAIPFGYEITIDENTPDEIYIVTDEPSISLAVYIPDLDCSNYDITVKKNTMNMDLGELCDEDRLLITALKDGDALSFESTYEVDWEGNEQPGKSYSITITKEMIEETLADGTTIKEIGATEVWDEEEANKEESGNTYWTKWQRSGKRTITYKGRTIKAGMWNPVCFPFAIDQTQMTTNFGTVIQFEGGTFSPSTGLVIECSYVGAEGMEANTPYLVMPDADKSMMKFTQVDVQTVEGKFQANTISLPASPTLFVGAILPETLPANDESYLFIGAGNKVYYPDQDVKLRGFRAYFRIPVGSPAQGRKAPARIVIRNREETPTALNDNVMQTNTTKYMQNGRLVIENNGVRYNAQGQAID